MNYIVLDLEFNQAFPFKSGKKVEPNPECPFEIIQIGAVKLNEHFEQLDSFNCMISPQIYPRLHPFVEKITGIRPKMLAGQPHFPEAYQAFLTFIGKKPAVLCAWGGDDINPVPQHPVLQSGCRCNDKSVSECTALCSGISAP